VPVIFRFPSGKSSKGEKRIGNIAPRGGGGEVSKREKVCRSHETVRKKTTSD